MPHQTVAAVVNTNSNSKRWTPIFQLCKICRSPFCGWLTCDFFLVKFVFIPKYDKKAQPFLHGCRLNVVLFSEIILKAFLKCFVRVCVCCCSFLMVFFVCLFRSRFLDICQTYLVIIIVVLRVAADIAHRNTEKSWSS